MSVDADILIIGCTSIFSNSMHTLPRVNLLYDGTEFNVSSFTTSKYTEKHHTHSNVAINSFVISLS